MEFVLTVTLENAAFGETDAESAEEVARILEETAARIRAQRDLGRISLRDINGNRVGAACLTGQE